LLTESWHPRFAEDGKVLSSHLAGRLRAEANVSRRVERAEIRELLGGDIPYFSAHVGRRAADARGERAAISGNGWREGAARIASLGASDRRRQAWIIALSMTDLSTVLSPSTAKQAPLARESILALAQSYGDRLCETAIVSGRRASWLYPMIENQRLIPACVGFGLYHGLPGIALFLARLWLAAIANLH
jgi:lantibiotic modifying enzyme